MKKVFSIILAFTFIVTAFSACNKNQVTFEDTEWTFDIAMNMKAGSLVVAVSEENSEIYPDAKATEITLSAKNGEIIIEDKTNNETYMGAYEDMYETDETNDYKVILEGVDGYAMVSVTEYDDDSEKPTLIISVGDYDMYFYAVNN